MLNADPTKVSARAKKRGLPQLGTLGAGNHYCEIQVVDEIFDAHAAARMVCLLENLYLLFSQRRLKFTPHYRVLTKSDK